MRSHRRPRRPASLRRGSPSSGRARNADLAFLLGPSSVVPSCRAAAPPGRQHRADRADLARMRRVHGRRAGRLGQPVGDDQRHAELRLDLPCSAGVMGAEPQREAQRTQALAEKSTAACASTWSARRSCRSAGTLHQRRHLLGLEALGQHDGRSCQQRRDELVVDAVRMVKRHHVQQPVVRHRGRCGRARRSRWRAGCGGSQHALRPAGAAGCEEQQGGRAGIAVESPVAGRTSQPLPHDALDIGQVRAATDRRSGAVGDQPAEPAIAKRRGASTAPSSARGRRRRHRWPARPAGQDEVELSGPSQARRGRPGRFRRAQAAGQRADPLGKLA